MTGLQDEEDAEDAGGVVGGVAEDEGAPPVTGQHWQSVPSNWHDVPGVKHGPPHCRGQGSQLHPIDDVLEDGVEMGEEDEDDKEKDKEDEEEQVTGVQEKSKIKQVTGIQDEEEEAWDDRLV